MNLHGLLSLALTNNASDLHLSANLPPLLRIDGELIRLVQPALSSSEISILLRECMNQEQFHLFTMQHDFDFAFELPNLSRFRVNIFQQQRGLAAVFRIIPLQIPTLESLNVPNVLKEIAQYSQGLVLVGGTTGSGKSTTLAALINYINENQRKHIISIEDPIEFIHPNKLCLINQRQVGRDTLNFATALRAALREDPDIIMVGELRDLETICLALTAAETGHLVLATLHTNSAAKSIDRIIDIFPGSEKNLIRNLLSESLQAVVCQKLVKKNNGGRIAAVEIMLATPAIRNLIREDKTAQIYSTIQLSKTIGMQTLEQHLQELTSAKIIATK